MREGEGRGGLPPALAARPAFLLAYVAHLVRSGVDRAVEPFGIRGRHFGLLSLLRCDGPRTQQALGERLQIDRTTMVGAIDDLERLGLARRADVPGNRRAHLVSITPAGEEMLDHAEARIAELEQRLFAPLSAAERDQLRDLLGRLIHGENT
jgi:DNA-binding MarR family transcriptional regulator